MSKKPPRKISSGVSYFSRKNGKRILIPAQIEGAVAAIEQLKAVSGDAEANAIAVHQRHVLGGQTAVNRAAVTGVAALAEHEHGLWVVAQADGTFFVSIAGISAKIARSFNRKRGFDGVHVGLQIGVGRGARVGFGLGGMLNRGQAVAHVLRQLVTVHAAARQFSDRCVAHLLLHVFDRVLNGLRLTPALAV